MSSAICGSFHKPILTCVITSLSFAQAPRGVFPPGRGVQASGRRPKSSASSTCRISISDSSDIELGQRLTPFDRLLQRRALQSQKPATSSFVSANGPSITVLFSPSNLTRAPLEFGCSPSPTSINPALVSSSLLFSGFLVT